VQKLLPIIAILIVGAVVLVHGQPRAPIVQSIDVSVSFGPVIFMQDGRPQLVYELHITNFQPVDVVLTAVRIATPAGTAAEYREAELQQRLVRPGFRNDHPAPQILGPGARAVLNVWSDLPLGTAMAVSHAIDLEVRRPSGAVLATIEGTSPFSRVRTAAAVALDAPLRGGSWIAIYDPLLKGGHRTAIYTIDGRARIPGRFAIDFVALPQSGALLPPSERATANGFGADVLAVADGVIVAAVDDTPDTATQPVPAERASGNYVALDLRSGHVAFYEHLQQGSIVVKQGQRVTRGQVIAKLGSSGSTSIGPHLHFHVADTNSLLGAEGLPFVFKHFTGMGKFASIAALQGGEAWQPNGTALPMTDTRPAPNSVINFP
jgi:murein DD-endopeptidase